MKISIMTLIVFIFVTQGAFSQVQEKIEIKGTCARKILDTMAAAFPEMFTRMDEENAKKFLTQTTLKGLYREVDISGRGFFMPHVYFRTSSYPYHGAAIDSITFDIGPREKSIEDVLNDKFIDECFIKEIKWSYI